MPPNFLKFLALTFVCFCLAGCALLTEPELVEEISINPASYWENKEPYIDPSVEVSDDITYFQTDAKHSLAELIDVALSNNPSTKFVWAVAKSQAYLYKASYSPLFPSVSFQENVNFYDQRFNIQGSGGVSPINPINTPTFASAGGPSHFMTTSSNLTIQYLLLDFGGRFANIEAAWQALVAENLLHNQAIQDLMITVITDYYTYLQNKALLDARAEDLKDAETLYSTARAQFDNGIVTKVDVLQSESNLASAVLAYQQQANLLINSLAALATAVGLPPETKFDVESAPFLLPKDQIKTDVEYLMEVAKHERADLASKQAIFLENRANLDIIRSNAMPTITANSTLFLTHYTNSRIKDSRILASTISLNIPIFQGFFFLNQIKSAEANVLAAYEDWRNTEQQVLLNVFTSYYNLQTAIDSLNVADEFLKFANEAFYALLDQYQNGVATITDLLTAEATLANARAQQIQSRTQLMISFAQLTYAMGILNSTSDYSDLFPEKCDEKK